MKLEKFLVKELYLPIIYILIGIVVYKLLFNIVKLWLGRKQKELDTNSFNYRKIETLKVLIKNIIKFIILILVSLACFSVFGINISNILAGLGIVTAVLALSLQDILKDIFGGLTIILENQFSMGDIISVGDFKGEVISIGLKTTRIKNYEGYIKIISNRNINEVINYSSGDSLAKVDISIAYEENNKKVEETLQKIADELSETLENTKSKVELLGIESLDSSSVIYRMVVRTKSMEHFKIQRIMKKEIKERLDKEKIKIPYTQIEVHNAK